MVNQYNERIDIYIKRMLEMTDKIELYTKNIKSYNEFIADQMVVDAVITPLTQLWEISNQIAKLQYEEFNKELPLKQMNEFRNFLVHTYRKIDYIYLRDVIIKYIPMLKLKLQTLSK